MLREPKNLGVFSRVKTWKTNFSNLILGLVKLADFDLYFTSKSNHQFSRKGLFSFFSMHFPDFHIRP